MNNNYESLTKEIEKSYTEGVTLEEAERLAGKFLGAQIEVANGLKKADLDARMRKSGVKAIKAAVYLNEVKKELKKPTEVMLQAIVDSNDLVQGEEEAFNIAEVDKNHLQNMFDIFHEAHIYFRGIAKGKFE